MGYEVAINKAREEFVKIDAPKNISVKFLGDEYTIDVEKRQVLSLSCNTAAKDFTAILILHYITSKSKGLPQPSGEWLTFRELAGIEGYYPAFRKRAIEPIIRKYGANPEFIFEALKRLPGEKVSRGDAAVALELFRGVKALVILWKGDEEFGPEANLLFDKNITEIFCTEDIVVLAGFIAV